jgi:hypothetical protein
MNWIESFEKTSINKGLNYYTGSKGNRQSGGVYVYPDTDPV